MMWWGSRGRAVAVTYGAGGNASCGVSLFFRIALKGPGGESLRKKFSCRNSSNLGFTSSSLGIEKSRYTSAGAAFSWILPLGADFAMRFLVDSLLSQTQPAQALTTAGACWTDSGSPPGRSDVCLLWPP